MKKVSLYLEQLNLHSRNTVQFKEQDWGKVQGVLSTFSAICRLRLAVKITTYRYLIYQTRIANILSTIIEVNDTIKIYRWQLY